MTSPAPNQTAAASSFSSREQAYAIPTVTKFKRIALASFLCGMAACVLVSLFGLTLLFINAQIADMLGQNMDLIMLQDGFLRGIGLATVMAAMNWFFAYFTVPAAWIAIGFSLGRMPRRGILSPMPYYRWGAIWGSLLVGGTTGTAAALFSEFAVSTILGAVFMGVLIGAVSGLICGAIFRGIVRPAEQVRQIEVDVF